MKKPMFAAALLALTLSACASMRGVQVGSDPVQTYAIQVTNSRSGTVSVSYSTGGAAVQLGTISPGGSERFVIPVSAPTQITVIARTTSGASAGNYPVSLEAGVTKRVTIR
ncbi:MAG TPA: hypothetical protein VGD27_17235 [Longimicrobiales bacterium]